MSIRIRRCRRIMSKEDDNNNCEEENENRGDPREIGKNDLVVATLIATVTFTAGFTLSGGFMEEVGPDQGAALLTRNTFFPSICYIEYKVHVLVHICSLRKPVTHRKSFCNECSSANCSFAMQCGL
ncbi:hypothetical protein EZV62_002870 [Acer yangbiense]|uniref:PGG domain-containing protein n=1 Tax=Acer yangbiense TaxID=1000413 RepID=A0A5C7IYI8_9ROSI|nr:hypothetical protein EZV62_002870 [Acer yangbiense]